MRCMNKIYAKKDVMNSLKHPKTLESALLNQVFCMVFIYKIRNGDVKCTINNTLHKRMSKFRISCGITICRNTCI